MAIPASSTGALPAPPAPILADNLTPPPPAAAPIEPPRAELAPPPAEPAALAPSARFGAFGRIFEVEKELQAARDALREAETARAGILQRIGETIWQATPGTAPDRLRTLDTDLAAAKSHLADTERALGEYETRETATVEDAALTEERAREALAAATGESEALTLAQAQRERDLDAKQRESARAETEIQAAQAEIDKLGYANLPVEKRLAKENELDLKRKAAERRVAEARIEAARLRREIEAARPAIDQVRAKAGDAAAHQTQAAEHLTRVRTAYETGRRDMDQAKVQARERIERIEADRTAVFQTFGETVLTDGSQLEAIGPLRSELALVELRRTETAARVATLEAEHTRLKPIRIASVGAAIVIPFAIALLAALIYSSC